MKPTAKIITFFLILLMIIQSTYTVRAESRDYTVDDGKRLPIPEAYTLKKVINNPGSLGEVTGYLKSPEDLFINGQGFLFVADTGNNRILKLSKDGKLLGIFNGPKDKPLKSPKGIYADNEGNMYVADTGNLRIVHLSADGEYIEEFTKPESELLGKSFTFDPSKIYVSPTGYIYAIKGQNILTLDAYNRFRGYLGQIEIGYSFVDSLLRIFASEEQKRVIRKRTAAFYTNMTMDDSGIIYATSQDMTEGEIKKLNSVGKNIYRKYYIAVSELLDFLTKVRLEEKSFTFGERKDDNGNTVKPIFNDISVDKNGIITALEEQTGKLYQYDQDGNLLAVFGGKGEQKGRFNLPCSLVTDEDGNIYVLDRVQGNIQVFQPSKFIKKVQQAVQMYSSGNYDQAYTLWIDVLAMDESYPLAHEGLGNALYKKEKWKEAMDEFTLAGDRNGYSKAFTEYRYSIFRKYFVVVAVIFTFLLITLSFSIIRLKKIGSDSLERFSKKASGRMSIKEGFCMSLGVVFHPAETFENIKAGRGRLNLVPGVIILVTALMVRIFYLFTVHYPLADVDLSDSNLWLEAIKLLLPAITWVIASYAITAIMDGESKIPEIFLASSYCMVPYILVNFPLALLSRVLSRGEITSFAVMVNGTWIWILLLFFVSLKTLNGYQMFKTAVTYTLSGVSMVLIWFVSMLGYVLTGRLYQFIAGIVHEINMLWL